MTISESDFSEIHQMFENKYLKLEQLQRGAILLKAAAHPIRIAILNYLNDGKPHSVNEIQNILNIEQCIASHHLGVMKNKELIASKRKGKNTFYYIKFEPIKTIINCIAKCIV